MNIQFGTGVVFGKPVAGNLAANPTPYRLGVVQEVTVDFKADLKKLYGQNQFPVATARGKINVDIKGKMAVFDPGLLNQLYWAQSSSPGMTRIADQEVHNIGATVTVTNSATFVEDFGVQYQATGQQLTPVTAGNPTVGQYKVNVSTGVYTMNTADTGGPCLFSYTYTSNASGQTIALANQLMGYAPEIKMYLYNNFRNKYFGVQLNDVTLGSVNIPTKLEDFWIMDFDGNANADASNTLGFLAMDNF